MRSARGAARYGRTWWTKPVGNNRRIATRNKQLTKAKRVEDVWQQQLGKLKEGVVEETEKAIEHIQKAREKKDKAKEKVQAPEKVLAQALEKVQAKRKRVETVAKHLAEAKQKVIRLENQLAEAVKEQRLADMEREAAQGQLPGTGTANEERNQFTAQDTSKLDGTKAAKAKDMETAIQTLLQQQKASEEAIAEHVKQYKALFEGGPIVVDDDMDGGKDGPAARRDAPAGPSKHRRGQTGQPSQWRCRSKTATASQQKQHQQQRATQQLWRHDWRKKNMNDKKGRPRKASTRARTNHVPDGQTEWRYLRLCNTTRYGDLLKTHIEEHRQRLSGALVVETHLDTQQCSEQKGILADKGLECHLHARTA